MQATGFGVSSGTASFMMRVVRLSTPAVMKRLVAGIESHPNEPVPPGIGSGFAIDLLRNFGY